MALTVVYEENLRRIYKSSTWSISNFWRWISETLIIAVTLIVAFESQGFWKKTNSYLEQPKIEFDKRCMIVLSSGSPDPFDYYFWSPYVDLNRAQADRLILPVVEIMERDLDDDTIVDEISVDISLRLTNETFAIRSVFWMLYYTANLKQHAILDMNGVVFGEIERLSPAKSLSISSDLQFWQRKPLPFAGHYNFTQDLVQLNETEVVFGSALYIPYEIQKSTLQNNFTFQLNRPIQHWETSEQLDNSTFTLNFKFIVPEQLLVYRTGALELLKWLWIQYFALSVLVRIFFDALTGFLFQNQLLESVVYYDETKSKIH